MRRVASFADRSGKALSVRPAAPKYKMPLKYAGAPNMLPPRAFDNCWYILLPLELNLPMLFRSRTYISPDELRAMRMLGWAVVPAEAGSSTAPHGPGEIKWLCSVDSLCGVK